MPLRDRAQKYKDSLDLRGMTGSNIRCTTNELRPNRNSYYFFNPKNTSRHASIYFGTGRTDAESIYSIFKINEDDFVDAVTTITLNESMRYTQNNLQQYYTPNNNTIWLTSEATSLEATISHTCSDKGRQETTTYDCAGAYSIPVTKVEIRYFDDQTKGWNPSKIDTLERKIKKMFCSAFSIPDNLNNKVTVSPLKSPEDLPSLSQDVSETDPSTPPQSSVLTSTIKQQIKTLKNYKAIILEGVPGTGKTYGISKIVGHWEHITGRNVKGNASGNYAITMHPSTSYEDFVEGLRPNTDGKNEGKLFHTVKKPTQSKKNDPKKSEGFSYQDGFFKRICKEAAQDPDNDYLVLLDEFNRCNIPKVMGDLLTTLESSKRVPVEAIKNLEEENQYQTITLPYSKEIFFVPDNVYVIGTMNTTDRSVAPLDSALRRRFAFIRVWPIGFDPSNEQSLDDINKEIVSPSLSPVAKEHVRRSIKLYHDINSVLKEHGQDVLIGHSYLYDLQRFLEDVENEADCLEITKMVWNQSIFPQLIDSLRKNNLLKLLDEKLDNEKKLLTVLQGHTVIKRSGSGFQNIPTLLLQNLPPDPKEQKEANQNNGQS